MCALPSAHCLFSVLWKVRTAGLDSSPHSLYRWGDGGQKGKGTRPRTGHPRRPGSLARRGKMGSLWDSVMCSGH